MGYVVKLNAGSVRANFLDSAVPPVQPDNPPTPSVHEYDLTPFEEDIRDGVLSFMNAVNPVETGKRKYFSFVFLTDLHECKPGVPYGNGEKTCEHVVKLAGNIADTCGVTTVLCGGDLSTGGSLSFEDYESMMDIVKGYFNKYVHVPYYTTCGNHDKWYDANVKCRTNEDWRVFLQKFNSPGYVFPPDTTKLNSRGVNPYGDIVGSTYYVDFRNYNVRVLMRDEYEKQQVKNVPCDRSAGVGEGHYAYNVYGALQVPDATKWIILPVSHTVPSSTVNGRLLIYNYYLNGTKPGSGGSVIDYFDVDACNGGVEGRAVVGEITGHYHPNSKVYVATEGDKNYLNCIGCPHSSDDRTNIQYDTEGIPSGNPGYDGGTFMTSAYHFSVFVIDTDSWKLKMYKVTDWLFRKSVGGNGSVDTDSESWRSYIAAVDKDGNDIQLPVYLWDIRHNDYNN